MKSMVKYRVLLLIISVLLSCAKEPVIVTKTSTAGNAPILDDWEVTKTTFNFQLNPRDLFFINAEIGFVVGYTGDIYKTINAGVTWQRQNSGTVLNLFSVYFLDQNIGFASGQAVSGCLDQDCNKGSVFLKTNDGGETWTKTFFEAYVRIRSLHFFNESRGLALIDTPDVPNSRDYHLAKTQDGGASWEFIDLPIRSTYDKFFCVNDVVFIAGENQTIYKSSDFGEQWEALTTPVPASSEIRKLYFYNKMIGFVDGVTGIYRTTDGGLNWQPVSFPLPFFEIIHFDTATDGFTIEAISVYDGGDFPTFKGSRGYQTSNGGGSWTSSDLNDSVYIWLAHFPNHDLGYGINSTEFYTIRKKK